MSGWFNGTARRYASWAENFLDSNYAASLHHEQVAQTEWPMFGSVFFLFTAAELEKQGVVDCSRGKNRQAVDLALDIVVSPETATWVRSKWGDDYLNRENVFYRMLLIMGITSYEEIAGSSPHHDLMVQQAETLATELEEARFHLLDDYPGECYPNDVIWAVAACQRAGYNGTLGPNLMAVLDQPTKSCFGKTMAG